ncbi:hypothetical protein M3193_13280 [Sporosarcina luteola]|uniref:hypothetical protein n=1 Tax=Sporosarcina luteola TaxID=582850 RepID=UPI00203AD7FF|nr:hypothetical protein [Sporosarcina luteola]MCM3745106.1 hypothetical protein [Sporosarcina luteola]
MPKNITQFDLLISCPSDVKEELEIIKDTVADFNRMYGAANNTSIVAKHWSTDAYPQLGEKPQNLLNKQFVLECDAAVAVFWTRFGTPTDNYGSGTEEEIEELLKSGKQVFLYFSDRQINPVSINFDQYKKVLEFRERYKDKGIFAPYSDLMEFKKKFLNHLSLYFVNLLANGNEKQSSHTSKLAVKGVRDGKITENLTIYKRRSYLESEFMTNMVSNIQSLFEKVNNICLPDKTIVSQGSEIKMGNDGTPPALVVGKSLTNVESAKNEWQDQLKGLNSIFSSVELTLPKELQSDIESFVEEFSIEINNDIFNIGKLSKQKQPFGGGPFGTGSSYTLVGSEDEKEKYRILIKVYGENNEFRQWESFFATLESKYYLDLCLANFGTSYDEDVDIRLYVKTGYLCTVKQLPVPGNDILATAIKFIEPFFKPEKSLTVNEYADYPEYGSISSSDIALYGLTRSYEEKVESRKEEYLESIDNVFCYEHFQDDGYDVICYKQSYIKQNTNVFFPSIIVFHSLPDTIRYEISSKFFPEVIEGELKPILEN